MEHNGRKIKKTQSITLSCPTKRTKLLDSNGLRGRKQKNGIYRDGEAALGLFVD